MERRVFLRSSVAAVVAAGLGACGSDGSSSKEAARSTTSLAGSTTTTTAPPPLTAALGEASADGLRLMPGFSGRVIAVTGEEVAGTGYVWHTSPDGGAVFEQPDGGWIYVSNSESPRGGASMIRFDADGQIVEARQILSGTAINCAGGPTPWDTWLSCEEHPHGLVWECDPTGATEAQVRPALGRFKHEAAAVEPTSGIIYLTEDEPDGAFYRFTPDREGDLSAGLLEILTEEGGSLVWAEVPDPARELPEETPTRQQVPGTKRFDGGEGICLFGESIVFTTKGDDRVWRYDPSSTSLDVLYDRAVSDTPVLGGVDNVVAFQDHVYVCEDGDDMQVVRVSADGVAHPVLQVVGDDGSELTGVAFSPDGTRMYVSSQRSPGRTFEITGPW